MQPDHSAALVCTAVLAALTLAAGAAGPAGAQTQETTLSIGATTTVGEEPVSSIAREAGQTAEIHVDYEGFGEGTHDLTLRLEGSINGDPLFLRTSTLTVTGDSGRVTVRLDEQFDLSDVQTGTTLETTVLASEVGPDGTQSLQDAITIETVPATLYLTDVPADVSPSRTVSVGYYGWGREPLLDGIDLYADRPPRGVDEQGEDTLVATAAVEQAEDPFFQGSFRFVPEDSFDQVESRYALQARPPPDLAEVSGSNTAFLTVNRLPDAVIDVSPQSPSVGESVTFDAAGSTDPDGGIVRYEWDLDGDGDFERRGESVTGTYESSGPITVGLRVTDGTGGTDTDQRRLQVSPQPDSGFPVWLVAAGGGLGLAAGLWYREPLFRLARRVLNRSRPDGDSPDEDRSKEDRNRPPVAKASHVPLAPRANRPVLFDGSMSADPAPNDRVVTHRWEIDDRTHNTPRAVHVFSEGGDYDVTLTVTDKHGATGRWSETVSVEAEEGDLLLDGINPNPRGDDHEHPEDEYVVLTNGGESTLDLAGWTVHDAAQEEGRVRPDQHTFEFGEGVPLAPGERVVLHTGERPDEDAEIAGPEDARHAFWGKNRAVWNNDEDLIVVQDEDGSPALARRYLRSDSGEYELEGLDVNQLLSWFPDVDVSGSVEGERTGLSFDVGLDVLSTVQDFLAGALFMRGPGDFLVRWGTTALALVLWLAVGQLTGVTQPIVPLLLILVSVGMLLVGLVWYAASWVVSALQD